MRKRKLLKLRGLLIAYNLAMMTLSSYMFYEVRRHDWPLLGKHPGSVWKPEPFQQILLTDSSEGSGSQFGHVYVLPQEEQYCPTESVISKAYLISSRFSTFLSFIKLTLKGSWMNKLKVEISPVDIECMEHVEPPHFISGLAGEGRISEKENCFSRLLQSSPRVPSTLQLPAAETMDDIVFCLFSVHKPFYKPFPSSCRPLKTLQGNMA